MGDFVDFTSGPAPAGPPAMACGAAAFVFSTFLTWLTYRDVG